MSILTIIFNICKNKFAITIKRGVLCKKKNSSNMKNIFCLAIFSFLLISCEKEIASPQQTLTPAAKEVDEMVWGHTMEGSIGESIEINETTTYTNGDETHSFEVEQTVPYTTGASEQAGQGVAYMGGAYKVTAVKLTEFPDIITIVVYLDGEVIGSLSHHI